MRLRKRLLIRSSLDEQFGAKAKLPAPSAFEPITSMLDTHRIGTIARSVEIKRKNRQANYQAADREEILPALVYGPRDRVVYCGARILSLDHTRVERYSPKDTPFVRNRERNAGASALLPSGRGSTGVRRVAKGRRDRPDQFGIRAMKVRFRDHQRLVPPGALCSGGPCASAEFAWCDNRRAGDRSAISPRPRPYPSPSAAWAASSDRSSPSAAATSPKIADLPGRSKPARRSPTATPPIAASGAWSRKTRCSLMAIYTMRSRRRLPR